MADIATVLGSVGMLPREDWNALISDYEFLNIVRYQGSSYYVKIRTGYVPAGTLPTNTTYFAKQVDKGDKGDAGGQEVQPIQFEGKTITIYGDSIVEGSGVSPIENRWTTILCEMLGATEDNRGVSGTTLEKRIPINPFANPNMVDNMVTIPEREDENALLIIAYGINDIIACEPYPNYNSANFFTDYNTILEYAINIKNWPPSNILVIAPYWNGGSIVNRHLAFNESAKQASLSNGCLFVDPYNAMADNGRELLLSDGLHLNNRGNYFIASMMQRFLASSTSISYIKSNILTNKDINPAKVIFGSGELVVGEAAIYNDPSLGTVFTTKQGSLTDFVLANSLGEIVARVGSGKKWLELFDYLKTLGHIEWGVGALEIGKGKIYNDEALGTVITTKTGINNDLTLANSLGEIVAAIPKETKNFIFLGHILVAENSGLPTNVVRNLDLRAFSRIKNSATTTPNKSDLNSNYPPNTTTGVGLDGFEVEYGSLTSGGGVFRKIDNSATGEWRFIPWSVV